MSASHWDIDLEEGSDFDLEVQFQDANCDPVNVTGYGAKMQVRDKAEDSGPARLTASVANARITITGATGLFTINISAASVTAIKHIFPTQRAAYDLFIWPTAASMEINPKKLLAGKAKYIFAVTE